MRHKELRLAMVCYGGISLAVYMHGVTKEVWKLARASTYAQQWPAALSDTELIYADILDTIARECGLRIAILPDIVAGASAGGMNGVFLAQAIHSGQSLEPLTRMWLEKADIDVLLHPDAQGWTSLAKQWAVPLVRMMLMRGENGLGDDGINDPDSPVHDEIRAKLSRFVRSRWFEAPFSGIGFSRLIAEALDAMAEGEAGPPLLPIGHPIDLFTTATDFAGHAQRVALNSPPWVEEREHRVDIGFHALSGAGSLGALPELVFAARATASFPGAFPPLQVGEIDHLMAERGEDWPGREAFMARILPEQMAHGEAESTALMDGSILVNAPFAQAIAALPGRPAETEIDRRLIYIDPTQTHAEPLHTPETPGFFSAIFRALSTIPREQPIRDNLEALARQSERLTQARAIIDGIRPLVEDTVKALLGGTIGPLRPSADRLTQWRAATQGAAAAQAGYAYQAYAKVKLESTLDTITRVVHASVLHMESSAIRDALGQWAAHNLRLTATEGPGLSSELIAFLRVHDGAYRERRLRYLLRQLDEARLDLPAAHAADYETARAAAWQALSLCLTRPASPSIDASRALTEPGEVLRALAAASTLCQLDRQVDAILATALTTMAEPLARLVLHAYLGFAFYDVATLALLQGSGLAEMNPVKVDRISPSDATGPIRRLKGEEFHYFAAFFSRAYREHDYLLGRLHAAGRLIDILTSSSPHPMAPERVTSFRQRLFAAILEDEKDKLRADPDLFERVARDLALGST
ncbi:MAG: patatin-like protein [Sphingomonadales bacterium]|nr:patatin-like protein [Sphingomonadales bacterium]MDE2171843.1 patatin-like protein [Sphingomonadales bacterium]